MFLGIDASTQREVDEKNPHYFYQGKEVEPWSFLHDHNGVSSMRLRLWLNPYDEEGRPYGGGTNDYATFLLLARRAMKLGYSILLDFHYSDFWCDPSKQCIPKAWRGLNADQLAEKVGEYTKETLLQAKKDGIDIFAVQVGNEITNGMLWPVCKLGQFKKGEPRTGFDDLAKVLRSGTKAVREALPEAKVVIHLETSGNAPLHEQYYGEIIARGVDFDVIGESYYPYWHGTYEMLFNNIENLRAKYGKEIWIVETGYGFTMEPFIMEGGFQEKNLIDEEFFKQDNVYLLYPLTLDGQKQFIENLLRHAKEHNIGAVYYWEPFWLPLKGLEWASKAGETYINETWKPTNNEWANQCLFDYDGNATPGLDAYKL